MKHDGLYRYQNLQQPLQYLSAATSALVAIQLDSHRKISAAIRLVSELASSSSILLDFDVHQLRCIWSCMSACPTLLGRLCFATLLAGMTSACNLAQVGLHYKMYISCGLSLA